MKVYDNHGGNCNGVFSSAAVKALREHGVPRHIIQGTMLVSASTKAEAAAIIGESWKQDYLRLARDTISRAVIDAGVLDEPGRVVAFLHHGPVVDVTTGKQIGTLSYEHGKPVYTAV